MNDDRPILLLGGTGQLGRALQACLAPLGHVHAPPRATADLARPETLAAIVRDARPRLIVNAAAWTDVDGAEDDPAAAMAINATAPGVLAEEAAQCGAAMVQFSTDYVFDGALDRPYREDDPPCPLGVYGESKLAGEAAVRAALADHLILRTAWLYAWPGRNFVATIARLARREGELGVVADQVGSPTWAADLARETAAILARCPPADGCGLGGLAGTYHLAGTGAASRFAFARAILAGLAGRAPDRPLARLVPTEAARRPARARRPAYSALDSGAARRAFGLPPAPWEARLSAFFAALPPDTEF